MTKSETKDTSDGTNDKSDWDASVMALSFGKRFSLKGIGIQNLTYAPQVSVAYGTIGGDLEDAGVDSAVQVKNRRGKIRSSILVRSSILPLSFFEGGCLKHLFWIF